MVDIEATVEETVQDTSTEIGDPLDHVIATNISLEDYMENYAAQHCEWVEGFVLKISPVHEAHDQLTYFLRQLLESFFELKPIGRVRSAPFVLRLPTLPNHRREPDLMVILDTNPHPLTPTYMDGPADICIEVVSFESTARDYGYKFTEYERGGVREYWLIDSVRKQAVFYRLSDNGFYRRYEVDAQGTYHTPVLPGLTLHVPTLWQDKLPGPAATVELVQAMLAQQE